VSDLIICAPEVFRIRRIADCPTCAKRRRFVGLHAGFWYSVTWTCCGCGDRWTDGERHERPFRRGWRKRAVEKARADYGTAQSLSAYLVWARERIGLEVSGV
jgi:hypothetical protein